MNNSFYEAAHKKYTYNWGIGNQPIPQQIMNNPTPPPVQPEPVMESVPQQQTQPETNNMPPFNPYAQYKRQYYEQMGNYASQQLMPQQLPQQQFMNNNPYYYQQPMFQQQYYNPDYVDEYRYNNPQIRNQVFINAYNSGQLKMSDFVMCTDPATMYYANNQPQQQYYPTDAWGYQMNGYQNYMQQQQLMQQRYQEQLKVMEIGYRVASRCTGNTVPFEELYTKRVEYQQKMQTYKYQLAMKDAEYKQLDAIIERCDTSLRKGYVSPLRKAVFAHMSTIYEARHKDVPEDYGLNEFLNEGVAKTIIFNQMKMDQKHRERELFRLYDDASCRHAISQLSPGYDPISGLSAKGFKINKHDIDITLDPSIEQREYSKRRQAFIDSIMKDNRDNLKSVDEALARRAQNG